MATGNLTIEMTVDARAMIKAMDTVILVLSVRDRKKYRIRRWISARLINLAGRILGKMNPTGTLTLTRKPGENVMTIYAMAQVAYDAYVVNAGGKSLVTAQALPAFDQLPEKIKEAWQAAADAVERASPRTMTLADIAD
jgi:hypothetical protein